MNRKRPEKSWTMLNSSNGIKVTKGHSEKPANEIIISRGRTWCTMVRIKVMMAADKNIWNRGSGEA